MNAGEATRRDELATMLRSWRARLAPADVGLPEGARRRTPGLRREEVARLADVGTSWYTWLEQGRAIQVSDGLLDRLARALRLAPAERSHLFELAQPETVRHGVSPAAGISDALRRTIDAHPWPAVVTTPRWDALAMNAAARALWGDRVGTNSLWSTFVDPARRETTVAWQAHVRDLVARFRLEAGRAADRAPFDELARALAAASPEFRALWEENAVAGAPEGAKIVRHPEHGEIELDHVALLHVEPDGRTLRVTLYTPRPGPSTERAAAAIRAATPGATCG